MRYHTAGDSHGQALVVIIDEVPAGIVFDKDFLDSELARRRCGEGRSLRQEQETDCVDVLSGIRNGRTTGAPVALVIPHVAVSAEGAAEQSVPRPGHADLLGMVGYALDDCSAVSERASARETVGRVAAGAFAQMMLAVFGVQVSSFGIEDAHQIALAREQGDTLGSEVHVKVTGLLSGLGGYADARHRLTSLLGAALFSIPTVRSVTFGGCDASGIPQYALPGSQAHDGLGLEEGLIKRIGNISGGIEGGMSTGTPLYIYLKTKAIPTLGKPRNSVDVRTLNITQAPAPRHDISVAAALAVIAQAETALVLASEYQRRFGYGCMEDCCAAVQSYRQRIGRILAVETGES